MYFEQIYDRKLAQYAYFIGCQATGDAIVVDPQRDVERYLEIADREEFRITTVAETHIHADFLSGARELARRSGAKALLSDEGDADWKYGWTNDPDVTTGLLHDGDTFMVGNIRFEVRHTPGHTPEHLAFIVTDTPAGPEPMGILSGDFVFVGDVGRPDLLETAAGQAGAMEPSARRLFESLQSFKEMPAHLQLWPGHGAGSACGKALGAVPMSTVGYELSMNAALQAAANVDAFVEYVLDGQPEPPLYFGRMKRQNKEGPPVLGEMPSPRPMTARKLGELSGATGVAVIDTRAWESFRDGHLAGAVFAPMTRAFNTVAGSYVPEDMAIYLIVDESHIDEAVTDLIHVGLDNIVGYATLDTWNEYVGSGGKTVSSGEIDVAALRERMAANGAFVLDVRRASERVTDGYIDGTHNIAHTRLLDRLDELPKDQPILVHCRTGTRSGYAVGLLERHGYDATNVAGGIVAWSEAGAEVRNA